jgi:hypothetical protein
MDDPLERVAAELLSDPDARALIAGAHRLAGDEPKAAVRLIVLRLRQGRPCDDAMRATVRRAGRILERGRRRD